MKKKTISIIGTGVIGAGWAARFLASGHNVKAYDPNKRALKKLQKDVKPHLFYFSHRFRALLDGEFY